METCLKAHADFQIVIRRKHMTIRVIEFRNMFQLLLYVAINVTIAKVKKCKFMN